MLKVSYSHIFLEDKFTNIKITKINRHLQTSQVITHESDSLGVVVWKSYRTLYFGHVCISMHACMSQLRALGSDTPILAFCYPCMLE